uniref:ABC-type branched-chain amino acid transport system, substrate-binding protein n=1 Tax=Candidatus Kentrum sp. LPFa TaxID=2126335 RepID=A0A450WE23_9GAMM|nr:MAG: ABC-type branched-chain amino acid transport system, substrate-binding protein [Candidatus Kentron sp. LPFa]
MNKKKVLALSISLIVLVAILSAFYIHRYSGETIRIAVAGPMDAQQAEGIAMRDGVQLKVDQINANGGIDGKKVVVEYFDDGNDRKRAIVVANAIAERDDILMVIGHESSDVSMAASRIYRKAGIPAITASAMADRLTKDNEWYFRVISNTAFQGSYIANYMNRALKQKRVSIVYDTSAYGSSLVDNFKIDARKQGIEVVENWEISPDEEDRDARLKTIVTEIRAMENPGMLFLATLEKDLTPLLTLLRALGSEIRIFVAYMTEATATAFDKYPQEQVTPGFFTNRVLSVTPFLPNIANEQAGAMRRGFLAKYGREPLSWHTYTHYDATTAALKAIEHAEIQGSGHVRGDRKAIRAALVEMYSHEQGIPGTTGQIFFDENGDCNGHLNTAVFRNQKETPTYLQYKQTTTPITSKDRFQQTLEGKQLLIGGKIMKAIRVVFVGVDVTAIREVDFQAQHFTADFILWFRYEGKFDDDDIHFPDALDPVRLSKLRPDKIEDGITTKSYRVSARFSTDFDFADFPFERHRLAIRFLHNRLERAQLVYATDSLGVEKVAAGRKVDVVGASGAGWIVKKSDYFQDTKQAASTLGDPASFDFPQSLDQPRYNVELTIARSEIESQLRHFAPLIFLFLVLYLQFFSSGGIHWIRLLLISAILLSAVCLHSSIPMVSSTERFMAIEWAFYVFYGLIILALIEFNRAVRRARDNKKPGILGYVFSGITLFPLIMLTMIAFYATRYLYSFP